MKIIEKKINIYQNKKPAYDYLDYNKQKEYWKMDLEEYGAMTISTYIGFATGIFFLVIALRFYSLVSFIVFIFGAYMSYMLLSIIFKDFLGRNSL
ncbi:hypothetical protein IT400_00315 [Candidatus Nomurabacteria bacterium]|nr:hypothetical protein [Candidatus Nomurabacteria bacterium]